MNRITDGSRRVDFICSYFKAVADSLGHISHFPLLEYPAPSLYCLSFPGTVDTFFNMLSARVAVGSDDEGHLIIAAIDGQSSVRG